MSALLAHAQAARILGNCMAEEAAGVLASLDRKEIDPQDQASAAVGLMLARFASVYINAAAAMELKIRTDARAAMGMPDE